MSKGEIRDNAIERLIEKELVDTLPESLMWAIEISEASNRLRVASGTLKKAQTQEVRQQLAEIIESSELTSDEKRKLMSNMFIGVQ